MEVASLAFESKCCDFEREEKTGDTVAELENWTEVEVAVSDVAARSTASHGSCKSKSRKRRRAWKSMSVCVAISNAGGISMEAEPSVSCPSSASGRGSASVSSSGYVEVDVRTATLSPTSSCLSDEWQQCSVPPTPVSAGAGAGAGAAETEAATDRTPPSAATDSAPSASASDWSGTGESMWWGRRPECATESSDDGWETATWCTFWEGPNGEWGADLMEELLEDAQAEDYMDELSVTCNKRTGAARRGRRGSSSGRLRPQRRMSRCALQHYRRRRKVHHLTVKKEAVKQGHVAINVAAQKQNVNKRLGDKRQQTYLHYLAAQHQEASRHGGDNGGFGGGYGGRRGGRHGGWSSFAWDDDMPYLADGRAAPSHLVLAPRGAPARRGRRPRTLEELLHELQFREVTPEDYQLLLQLDESVKPKTVDEGAVAALESFVVVAPAEVEEAMKAAEEAEKECNEPAAAEEVGEEAKGCEDEEQESKGHESHMAARAAAPTAASDADLPRREVEAGTTCCICMEEMVTGVVARQLPCAHLFHAECIDQWLTGSSVRCPMCGFDVAEGTPTPADAEGTSTSGEEEAKSVCAGDASSEPEASSASTEHSEGDGVRTGDQPGDGAGATTQASDSAGATTQASDSAGATTQASDSAGATTQASDSAGATTQASDGAGATTQHADDGCGDGDGESDSGRMWSFFSRMFQ